MTQNTTRESKAGTNYTARTLRLLGQVLWLKVAVAELFQVLEEPLDSFDKLHDTCILDLASQLTYDYAQVMKELESSV